MDTSHICKDINYRDRDRERVKERVHTFIKLVVTEETEYSETSYISN